MKTIKQVEIIPIFLDGYLPPKEEMEFGKIYISKEYNVSNHLCLCGCNEECYLSLKPLFILNFWNLIEEVNGTISLTPSILQRFPCKSHYIITKNKANFV